MKVSSVKYNPISLKGPNNNVQSAETQKVSNYRYSPVSVAATTAGGTFIMSYGIDRVINTLFKLGNNRKQSAIFSALLGLGLGAYTYYQAKKDEKANNV